MRILVTGVTGFIGGHLAERLHGAGWAVRGLARTPDGAATLAAQGIEIVQGSLLDRSSLTSCMPGCDAVIHAGAWTGTPGVSESDAWITNVAATGWLLDAARQAGVHRFVYLSSVAVYGLNSAAVIDETAATPVVGQLYPDSKIAAEALVRGAAELGLATTIIRPASTYGPRATAWTVGPVEQIMAGSLVLLGRDEGLVNTGYIDNFVDGVLLALSSPAAGGETFNICDGETTTYRDFYLRYAAMLGKHQSADGTRVSGQRRGQPTWPLAAAAAGQAATRSVERPFPLQPQPLQHRQGRPAAGLHAACFARRGDAAHKSVAARGGVSRRMKTPNFLAFAFAFGIMAVGNGKTSEVAGRQRKPTQARESA